MTGGRTVILEVHGQSGVGKSTLVQGFLEGLNEGDEAVVLAGRCYEQESVPYKAFDAIVDTLARYLTTLPQAEARALLPRDVGALARVFPALRRVETITEAPRRAADVPDPQELRRRAFAALRDLLARLGDHRPLVLSIDDAQWGDLDSATLLADVLRPPDPPCSCSWRVIGARTGRPARSCGPSTGRRGRSTTSSSGASCSSRPLTQAESRELALTLIGHASPAALARVEEVARESGGNPFFVGELVRHFQAGEQLSCWAVRRRRGRP